MSDDIQGTIQPDILQQMRKSILNWMSRYRNRPSALALGPEEFLNWECAFRSNFQQLYDREEISEYCFEGVKIFCAPINGIMILDTGQNKLAMIDHKRTQLEGLH